MEFSPHLMAQLPIEEFQREGSTFALTPMFHWRGTYSAFANFVKACEGDNSEAGAMLRERLKDMPDSWSGIRETFPEWASNGGIFSQALSDFQKAQASLAVPRKTFGETRPAASGAAWVMPLVISDHPTPALRRIRTKLPLRDIGFYFSARSNIRPEAIAQSIAPIARAAWEYIKQGGALRLTVHYSSSFTLPCAGAHGVIFSISVPLTDSASLASAVSVQCKRGLQLPLAQALSGQHNDSLPLRPIKDPRAGFFSGSLADGRALASLLQIRSVS